MANNQSLIAILAISVFGFFSASAHAGPASTRPLTSPTTQPSILDGWIEQLGSSSSREQSDAEIALYMWSPMEFDLIEQATKKPNLSPMARDRLLRIVNHIKPWQEARMRLNAQRTKETQWIQNLAVESYMRYGRVDPKWDEDAKAGIEVGFLGGTAGHARLEKAIEAGCDDPLVLYCEARYLETDSPVDRDVVFAMYRRATAGMPSTNYPRYLKAQAFMAHFYFGYLLSWTREKGQKEADRKTWDAAWPALRRATDLWPKLAAEQVPPRLLEGTAARLTDISLQSDADGKKTFDTIYPPLEKALPKSPLLYHFKGAYFLRYAWQARGGGYANTVTPQNLELFQERLVYAADALTQAWKMDPTDPRVPELMLDVELGQGKGKAVMETWFGRAMQANPDDRQVCSAKLNYLRPRWYGSHEEMLRFGHECFDSRDWYGDLPFILVEAHKAISDDFPDKSAYFSQPAVWKDLKSVYEPFLRLWPDNTLTRSYYCYYACLSQHWKIAQEQFNLLDGNVSALAFGGSEELKRLRQLAAQNGTAER